MKTLANACDLHQRAFSETKRSRRNLTNFPTLNTFRNESTRHAFGTRPRAVSPGYCNFGIPERRSRATFARTKTRLRGPTLLTEFALVVRFRITSCFTKSSSESFLQLEQSACSIPTVSRLCASFENSIMSSHRPRQNT